MSTTLQRQSETVNEQSDEYDVTEEQLERIRFAANNDCPCQEIAQSILKVIDD